MAYVLCDQCLGHTGDLADLRTQHARLREEFHRVMDKYENDLSAAHAEIVKLQGGNPAKYTWPEWSGPANSLRWFERLREQFPRAILQSKEGA